MKTNKTCTGGVSLNPQLRTVCLFMNFLYHQNNNMCSNYSHFLLKRRNAVSAICACVSASTIHESCSNTSNHHSAAPSD